ncbi:hypothetical protein AUR64_02440 [Haloprofundus marisrubri]|uniref:Uncharacterized protein n=1 Tax=Haloprofundus marisrubri TaxID=1514971 RepID=A0A0W1R317_9EURY|nr:hypothetical protein AUR64_02440 [Haloprofundus marisrubri]
MTEYETARHVVDGRQQLVRTSKESVQNDERLLIVTDDDRSALSFPTEDNTPVTSFVATTDLTNSSLALFQAHHSSCQRFDAYQILRRPAALRVHLCTEPRPADEECQQETDRSTLLAFKFPFDGSTLSELETVVSSECRSRFGPAPNGGTN